MLLKASLDLLDHPRPNLNGVGVGGVRRQNNSTSKTAVATNKHRVRASTVASSRASRLLR